MINIRLAKQEDLDRLAEIYVETYKNVNVGEHWTKETAYKMLEHWFKLQPDLAYVAEYQGKVVGALVVAIKPWWNGNRMVDGELFVHPNFQARGIGKELLKKVISTAKEKYNVKSWDTVTFKKFEFPLSWYKRLGFMENQEWIIISGNTKKILKMLESKV